jgi:hypothetical protein
MTGKSRTTLTKHIRQGKISCEIGPDGSKLIDASELARVYGDDFKLDIEEGASVSDSPKAKASGGAEQGVQQQLNTVQLQLDMVTKERERERQQYQQQIENLQSSLKLAQEGHNKAMLLLEHRTTGGGEWEKKFQELEEKLANRQASEKQADQLMKAAKQEAGQQVKSLPWWKVVWSR